MLWLQSPLGSNVVKACRAPMMLRAWSVITCSRESSESTELICREASARERNTAVRCCSAARVSNDVW